MTCWLRLRSKQAIYLLLSIAYGFDKWHYRVVRENCGYFRGVKTLHDGLGPTITIEIGCGLGEIISGLRAQVRVGIDRDPRVVGAARLVRGGSVRFYCVSDDAGIGSWSVERGPVCLVFLNWLHGLPREEISNSVGRYIRKFHPTHLIFDVIGEDATSYQFKHSPHVLDEFGKVAAVASAGDDVRDLVVLRIDERFVS